MYTDLFFLNPTEKLLPRIENFLGNHGFVQKRKIKNEKRYVKGTIIVDVCDCEDSSGKFIIVGCFGVDNTKLREVLSVCPECGSKKLKPSIFHSWKNELTEQLNQEDKLDYGYGAYERFGTRPPTKTCLNCGFKWHNYADLKYWHDIVKTGKELTVEDLGVRDCGNL